MDKLYYNQNGMRPIRNDMRMQSDKDMGYGVEENLRMRNDVMAQRREMERTNTDGRMHSRGMKTETKDQSTGLPIRTSMPGTMSPMPGEMNVPQNMMEGNMAMGSMRGRDQNAGEQMRQSDDMRRMSGGREGRMKADRRQKSEAMMREIELTKNLEDRTDRSMGAGVFAQEQAKNIMPLGSSKFLTTYMSLMSKSR